MKVDNKKFKINVVKLGKRSNHSIYSIARELGLKISPRSSLIKDYNQNKDDNFTGKENIQYSKEEVMALQKELDHVRQERDILKKAVAIFSVSQERRLNS